MDKIPTQTLISIHKLIEELNKNAISINTAYLFGSYANNTFNDLSDIDIALVSDYFTGNRFLDKELIRKYVIKINTDISPMPFNSKDFNQNNIMAQEILNTGLEISIF